LLGEQDNRMEEKQQHEDARKRNEKKNSKKI